MALGSITEAIASDLPLLIRSSERWRATRIDPQEALRAERRLAIVGGTHGPVVGKRGISVEERLGKLRTAELICVLVPYDSRVWLEVT